MTGAMILLGCLALGQGQPETPSDLATTVRQWVRQLDADELARRNAAEAKLVELGPAALDHLPEPTDRTPAEVRERLVRIRQRLQQAAAEASVAASRVTLKNRAILLSECLAEIQRQTGNRIKDLREQLGQEVSDPTLSVTFDNTPFWTAMDDVLEQAKLTIYPFGAEKAIGLVGRSDSADAKDADHARGSTSGPLRFMPLDLVARRNFSDGASALSLRLGILWEPRLAPISLKQRLSDIQAVDERGRRLALQSDEAQLEVPVNSQSPTVEVTIPLALPPRDTREIARLAGTIEAVLPGRIETFRFDRLLEAKKVEKHSAGVTVTLDQVRRNGEIWEVWVRVKFNKTSGALESYRGWVFDNETYMEGPDGKRIDHDGLETSRRTETEIGLVYLFDLPKPPDKSTFVYKTPSAIIATGVKYELKGLKLP